MITLKRCPGTGRITGVQLNSKISKLFLPMLGLASLVWFIFRVIPKPSRAGYPCMKVATPLASGFVAWILGMIVSTFAIHKARTKVREARYIVAGLFVLLAVAGTVWMTGSADSPVYAVEELEEPNTPMGEAKGIFPGRVVWTWDQGATNEDCENNSDDYWWEDKNNNMSVIETMLSKSLQELTGTDNDASAWDALFRDFNKNQGKGDVGFTDGEKIAVKINLGCEWSRNVNSSTGAWRDNGKGGLKRIDSTPQVVHAVLRQLVKNAGIAEEAIGIGDPIRNFAGPYYDLCHGEFPNVIYWSKSGMTGRTQITPSDDDVWTHSDGEDTDGLYEEMMEADYMINVPTLKAHARAGITIGAKNHYGSHTRGDASHLHRSLPDGEQDGNYDNGQMGRYRSLVDILGHEHLGGKTMLYVVDAIWGAKEAVDPPNKWQSAPFNDDWPNSLILGQDQVAVESVGFDFLYEEYSLKYYSESDFDDKGDGTPFPHKPGVQDYLHQAADPTARPAEFTYDPEGDGSTFGSLGVHEHWNSPEDKQYSRNLGTGEGIELVKVFLTSGVEKNPDQIAVNGFELLGNYPNPFNPSTKISYTLPVGADVRLTVFDASGRLVRSLVNETQTQGAYIATWDGYTDNLLPAASGLYIARLTANGDRHYEATQRMMLLK